MNRSNIRQIRKWVIVGVLACLLVVASRPLLLRYALFTAVKRADLAAVQTLLKQGADANSTDADGSPAITSAVRYYQRKDVIASLLDSGAYVDARDAESQETALSLAAGNRGLDIAQMLILHGADVNARDFHDETPLIHAAIEVDDPMIRLLLNHGANASIKDGYFETAADYVPNLPANHDLIALLKNASRKSQPTRTSNALSYLNPAFVPGT